MINRMVSANKKTAQSRISASNIYAFGDHHDLIVRYEISISQMTLDSVVIALPIVTYNVTNYPPLKKTPSHPTGYPSEAGALTL